MNDLYNTVKSIFHNELANIHTVTIAKITKVNDITINCQPVINRMINGQDYEMPEFVEVPLITLQGGTSYMHMPVAVDDYCLLFISERCFDRWYKGQDNMPPLSHRCFDYSDSFALVGVYPEAQTIKIPDRVEVYAQTENIDITAAQKTISLNASKEDITLSAEENITAGANSIKISGATDITIDGPAITISGKNIVINASASITLSSSAITLDSPMVTATGTVVAPTLAVGAMTPLVAGGSAPIIDDLNVGGVNMANHVHQATKEGADTLGPSNS